MYAKLENGVLKYAPKKVVYNSHIIFNPGTDVLTELGYLEVQYTDMPTDATEGKMYVSSWEQQEDKIVQVWNLVDVPKTEPTLEERVSNVEETLEILSGGVVANEVWEEIADISLNVEDDVFTSHILLKGGKKYSKIICHFSDSIFGAIMCFNYNISFPDVYKSASGEISTSIKYITKSNYSSFLIVPNESDEYLKTTNISNGVSITSESYNILISPTGYKQNSLFSILLKSGIDTISLYSNDSTKPLKGRLIIKGVVKNA